MPKFKKNTGFKMKGSTFYGKNGTSPVKQLMPQYMRTPEEKAFYETAASKDYEPVPMGTYRGPGAYSKYTGEDEAFEWGMGNKKPRKKGDTISLGVPGGKKQEVGTSEKIGPAESPEMIAEKERLALETKKGPSGTTFDASDADYEKDKQERKAYREAKKYVKKKKK